MSTTSIGQERSAPNAGKSSEMETLQDEPSADSYMKPAHTMGTQQNQMPNRLDNRKPAERLIEGFNSRDSSMLCWSYQYWLEAKLTTSLSALKLSLPEIEYKRTHASGIKARQAARRAIEAINSCLDGVD